MSGAWVIGPVTIKEQFCGDIIEREIAGWVNGPLGLHFAVFDGADGYWETPGFVVTHLATGRIVRLIEAHSTSEAKRLATLILEVADWNFDSDLPPANIGAKVKALMADHDAIVSGHRVLGPLL